MYTTRPKLPADIAALYETILEALHGNLTPTEAAQKLGMSTVQVHNLLNRAAAGVLEALAGKKPGRQARPEKERKLLEEKERLEKENRRLQERVETIDRLMTVAGGILRGQVRTVRRKKKAEEGGSNEPEDPDGAARRKVAQADELQEAGMSAVLAAALVGASAATLRRWRLRIRRDQAACQRRGPGCARELEPAKRAQVIEIARELHALCGAASLAKARPAAGAQDGPRLSAYGRAGARPPATPRGAAAAGAGALPAVLRPARAAEPREPGVAGARGEH
jgi:transposase